MQNRGQRQFADWALSKNQRPADPRVNRMDAGAESRVYRMFRNFWHPVIYSDELGDTPQQVWVAVPSTDWEHTFAVRRAENYIDPAHLPGDLSMEMYLAEVDIFSLHYRKWLLELADDLVPADDG